MIQSRGRFIVFEGGDNVGKTTQSRLLHSCLPNSCLFRYPNRTTPIGHILGSYLSGELKTSNQAINLLFLANLWEIIEDVNKCLEEGKTVIMDRYVASHFAFSVYLRDADPSQLKILFQGLPVPDLTFYLSKKNGYASDKQTEIYDKSDLQCKVLQGFESFPLKDHHNWISIGCDDLSVRQVHELILQKL